MVRKRSLLSPAENRALGSMVRALWLGLFIYGSVKIWGSAVFLKPWFDILLAVIYELSYRLTGWLLRKLRIWHY